MLTQAPGRDALALNLASPGMSLWAISSRLALFPSTYGHSRGFFLAGPGEFTAAVPHPRCSNEEAETLECGQRGLGSRKGRRPNRGTENLLSFLKFMVGSLCLSYSRGFVTLPSF